MAYRKISTINGRKYAYLVESKWDPKLKQSRQRVIQYLGAVDETGDEPKVRPARPRVDSVERVQPIGKIAAYWAVAHELHILSVVESVVGNRRASESILAMAINQACHRRSLTKAVQWVNDTPLLDWMECTPFQRSDFEEALESLCYTQDDTMHDAGARLQRALTKQWRRTYTKQPAEAYYDITKIPYHGDTNALAERGYALGRRGGRYVGVGLVVSRRDAFPVICRPIPGSRKDSATLPDVIHILTQEGLKGLTLVMDRGIVTASNISQATQNGFHVLEGCPASTNDTQDGLSRFTEAELMHRSNAIRRPNGSVVYLKGWNGSFMGNQGRLVLVFDPVRRAQEASERDGMIAELQQTKDQKRVKELRRALGRIVVASRGRRGFRINEEAVAREAKMDGRFLLFTTRQDLKDQDVFRIYFQKDEIEKTFQSLKGEIRLGPVRFRRPERITAYLTVVFVAYLLRAAIAYKLRKAGIQESVDEALETLASWSQVEFTSSRRKVQWQTKTTAAQEKVIRAIGIQHTLPRG